MGLQIAELVPRKDIELSSLKHKIVCVDAFNAIYQFLSTIRQPDGTPLMDRKMRVTSHLSGLFYRNINLLCEGIKLIYVFDGIPPEQKVKTQEIRRDIKDQAREKYEQARQEKDVEGMGKYARQFAGITSEIIKESKELLEAMGIAVVQSPSEGESQAAALAKTSSLGIYAVASQDYDSLLFGAPKLIQNLTLSQKRKTVSGYVAVKQELIELEKVLNSLQINLDQLICLGILVGTDYNPGGIRGIGPKKALQLVKQYQQPVLIFKAVENKLEEMKSEGTWFDWQEIFELFKKPNVEQIPEISFPKLDKEKIKEILTSHDFSEERILNQFEKLDKSSELLKQKTLF